MFYYMIRNRLVENKIKLFDLILPHSEFTIKCSNTDKKCKLTGKELPRLICNILTITKNILTYD